MYESTPLNNYNTLIPPTQAVHNNSTTNFAQETKFSLFNNNNPKQTTSTMVKNNSPQNDLNGVGNLPINNNNNNISSNGLDILNGQDQNSTTAALMLNGDCCSNTDNSCIFKTKNQGGGTCNALANGMMVVGYGSKKRKQPAPSKINNSNQPANMTTNDQNNSVSISAEETTNKMEDYSDSSLSYSHSLSRKKRCENGVANEKSITKTNHCDDGKVNVDFDVVVTRPNAHTNHSVNICDIKNIPDTVRHSPNTYANKINGNGSVVHLLNQTKEIDHTMAPEIFISCNNDQISPLSNPTESKNPSNGTKSTANYPDKNSSSTSMLNNSVSALASVLNMFSDAAAPKDMGKNQKMMKDYTSFNTTLSHPLAATQVDEINPNNCTDDNNNSQVLQGNTNAGGNKSANHDQQNKNDDIFTLYTNKNSNGATNTTNATAAFMLQNNLMSNTMLATMHNFMQANNPHNGFGNYNNNIQSPFVQNPSSLDGPNPLLNGLANNCVVSAMGGSSSTAIGPPPSRIFNPEAFCELCNKEFCNKYFLKTHKANKHGVFDIASLNNFYANNMALFAPQFGLEGLLLSPTQTQPSTQSNIDYMDNNLNNIHTSTKNSTNESNLPVTASNDCNDNQKTINDNTAVTESENAEHKPSCSPQSSAKEKQIDPVNANDIAISEITTTDLVPCLNSQKVERNDDMTEMLERNEKSIMNTTTHSTTNTVTVIKTHKSNPTEHSTTKNVNSYEKTNNVKSDYEINANITNIAYALSQPNTSFSKTDDFEPNKTFFLDNKKRDLVMSSATIDQYKPNLEANLGLEKMIASLSSNKGFTSGGINVIKNREMDAFSSSKNSAASHLKSHADKENLLSKDMTGNSIQTPFTTAIKNDNDVNIDNDKSNGTFATDYLRDLQISTTTTTTKHGVYNDNCIDFVNFKSLTAENLQRKVSQHHSQMNHDTLGKNCDRNHSNNNFTNVNDQYSKVGGNSPSLTSTSGVASGTKDQPGGESYCTLCKKEFCNKYFLKKHKRNIHGIMAPSITTPPITTGSSLTACTTPNNNNHMIYNNIDKNSKQHSQPMSSGHRSYNNRYELGEIPQNNSLNQQCSPLFVDKNFLAELGRESSDNYNRTYSNRTNNNYTHLLNDMMGRGLKNDDFSVSSTHNLAHSNSNNLSCSKCDKTFSNSHFLRSHLHNVHGEPISEYFASSTLSNNTHNNPTMIGNCEEVGSKTVNIHKFSRNVDDDIELTNNNIHNKSDSQSSYKALRILENTNKEKDYMVSEELNWAALSQAYNTDMEFLCKNYQIKNQNSQKNYGNKNNESDKSDKASDCSGGAMESSRYLENSSKTSINNDVMHTKNNLGTDVRHLISSSSGKSRFSDTISSNYTQSPMDKVINGYTCPSSSLPYYNNNTAGTGANNNVSSLSSSFCQICQKELCNKYFLKTHMIKMHGITLDEAKRLLRKGYPLLPQENVLTPSPQSGTNVLPRIYKNDHEDLEMNNLSTNQNVKRENFSPTNTSLTRGPKANHSTKLFGHSTQKTALSPDNVGMRHTTNHKNMVQDSSMLGPSNIPFPTWIHAFYANHFGYPTSTTASTTPNKKSMYDHSSELDKDVPSMVDGKNGIKSLSPTNTNVKNLVEKEDGFSSKDDFSFVDNMDQSFHSNRDLMLSLRQHKMKNDTTRYQAPLPTPPYLSNPYLNQYLLASLYYGQHQNLQPHVANLRAQNVMPMIKHGRDDTDRLSTTSQDNSETQNKRLKSNNNASASNHSMLGKESFETNGGTKPATNKRITACPMCGLLIDGIEQLLEHFDTDHEDDLEAAPNMMFYKTQLQQLLGNGNLPPKFCDNDSFIKEPLQNNGTVKRSSPETNIHNIKSTNEDKSGENTNQKKMKSDINSRYQVGMCNNVANPKPLSSGQYKCWKCRKSFIFKDSLLKHIKSHRFEFRGKFSRFRNNLNYNMNSHPSNIHMQSKNGISTHKLSLDNTNVKDCALVTSDQNPAMPNALDTKTTMPKMEKSVIEAGNPELSSILQGSRIAHPPQSPKDVKSTKNTVSQPSTKHGAAIGEKQLFVTRAIPLDDHKIDSKIITRPCLNECVEDSNSTLANSAVRKDYVMQPFILRTPTTVITNSDSETHTSLLIHENNESCGKVSPKMDAFSQSSLINGGLGCQTNSTVKLSPKATNVPNFNSKSDEPNYHQDQDVINEQNGRTNNVAKHPVILPALIYLPVVKERKNDNFSLDMPTTLKNKNNNINISSNINQPMLVTLEPYSENQSSNI